MAGWFIVENPIKIYIYDLEVADFFRKPPVFILTQ
jgi:hypothetical protein